MASDSFADNLTEDREGNEELSGLRRRNTESRVQSKRRNSSGVNPASRTIAPMV